MAKHTPSGPVTRSRRGSFWVGTEPVETENGTVERGPMYVEWEAPADGSAGVPWVLVHGGGGQGTDYLTTPDHRLGWSRLLVEHGATVYVPDRPGHGRSPHHPDVLGAMAPPFSAEMLRPIFLPPTEGPDCNPVAHLHTQWPGGREAGDPVYDQWLAAAGPILADWTVMHALERDRLGGAARARRPGDRRDPLGRRAGRLPGVRRQARPRACADRDRDDRPAVPQPARAGNRPRLGGGVGAADLLAAGSDSRRS